MICSSDRLRSGRRSRRSSCSGGFVVEGVVVEGDLGAAVVVGGVSVEADPVAVGVVKGVGVD